VKTGHVAERIAERARAAGVQLGGQELEQLAEYYQLLERWNRTINLTSLPLPSAPDGSLDRLLIEPLLASQDVPDATLDWADFGSGGGSPALPLKIIRPHAHLTMVECRERKSAFLREVVRSLGITGADVVTARIEELPDLLPHPLALDMITVRGIRLDAPVLTAAARLLDKEGRLLVFRSKRTALPSDSPFREVAIRVLEPSGFLSTLRKTT